MNEDIIQFAALTLAVMGVLITLSSGILVWNFKNQIKRLDNVENENNEIKNNYLNRFDEIKTIMGKHNNIMQAELSSLKIDIALIKQKIGIIN